MKTWRVMMNEPVEATLMATALQSNTGSESVSLEQRAELGVWEWIINSSNESRAMMEEHQDMLRYNKGGNIFWFDGGINCEITRRCFVGYGDGTTKDFVVPYRWLYPESAVFSVNNATVTSWTITGRIISFVSAPAAGALIYLEKGKMRYKAYFKVDGEKLYDMTDEFKAYSSKEMIIREFPN
jgi:hypothetical protein